MKCTTVVLSLAAVLVILPGCGGDKEKTPTNPTTDKTPAATPSTGANAFAKAKGKVIFNKTCIACHGEGGVGVEGLGKNWVTSEFIKTNTDRDLLEFLKVGRPLTDPLSAGITIMPARGGDPTLTDEDLENVIVYMRSLQK